MSSDSGDGSQPAVLRAWPRGEDLVVEVLDPNGCIRSGWRTTGGVLELNETGIDPGLVGLPEIVERAGGPQRIVGHRLGRRCVLRGDGVWFKVVRRSKVSRAAEGHRRITASLEGASVVVPELLSVDTATGVMVLEHLDGVTLFDHDDPVAAAEHLGVVLGNWQRRAPTTGLGIHDAAAEREVLSVWAGHAVRHAVFDGPERSRFARLLRAADRALGSLADRPLVASHRDLHDGQVLLEGSRVGVLDWDTAAAADPALDLANLMAHVDLAYMSRRISGDTADAVSVTLRRAWRLEAHEHAAALDAYRAAARVRLVAVHAFRPPTRQAARGLLHLERGSGAQMSERNR